MKIIVNTVPFKKEKLENFIPIFNRFNIHEIELHIDHFFSNDYDIENVQTLFKNNNIKVMFMSGGWCDFYHEGQIKEETFDSVKKQIKLMNYFNCSKIRLFFGRIFKELYNIEIENILINNLKELADNYPYITFFFETHDFISANYKILKVLLEKIDRDNIKINFDAANIQKEGFDPYLFLVNIRPWIRHLHIKGLKSFKGTTIKDFFCSYGEGFLSYVKIFEFLMKTNYEDFFSIEFEGYGDPIEEILKSKQLLINDLEEMYKKRDFQ